MNKTLLTIIGIVAVVGVVLGFAAYKVERTVYVSTPVGAVASSDLMTNWFSFGGVRQWASKAESLIQVSSTVCAIQGPAATSTLDHGSIRFTLASTTAVTVDLAKGTTQYATSTTIGSSMAVAGSAQATIVASSTGSVTNGQLVFAPNEWFVVRINQYSASVGVGNVPTGICQARWTNI